VVVEEEEEEKNYLVCLIGNEQITLRNRQGQEG
jgi:hypothetical protein